MSDFRAISGVSETLRSLLLDRMELPDGTAAVPVTIGVPTATKDTAQPEAARLNLFLYRVGPSAALRNQEIPGSGSPGAYGHPPLSLTLHYLLTPYGTEKSPDGGATQPPDDTVAQRLLGSAMRVLHDVTVVTDGLTTVRPPVGTHVLHPSLHHQFEKVKVTLDPMSLEDSTKVWTALSLRFRLSAAYVVSVVQIESRRTRTFPRPVGRPASPQVPPSPHDPPGPGPAVRVALIQPPVLGVLSVRRAGAAREEPYPYARPGDTLVLRGAALGGRGARVSFGDVTVPAGVLRGDRIEVTVPDLPPGVRTVRVLTGDPVTTSNDAAFMLLPAVSAVSYEPGARLLTVDGAGLAGGTAVVGVLAASPVRDGPARMVLRVPDDLPARDVQQLVSGPLADPPPLADEPKELTVTIRGVQAKVRVPLTLPASLAEVAEGLDARVSDADPAFRGTRVRIAGDRLVLVPGGLVGPVAVAAVPGSAFAAELGFAAAPPALLSGRPRVPLSAARPRVAVAVGGNAPVEVTLPPAATLDELAAGLQAALRDAGIGAATAEVWDGRLLLRPAGLHFGPTSDDVTTVAELLLRARYAVRVRVNGAESADDAWVDLP